MKIRALLGVTLLSVLFAAPVEAKDYNYATFVPPASSNNTLALVPAFKKISEETNGEVNIKLFAGGQLLGGKEMLGGLRDGIADAGFIAPNYFISEMPNAALIPDMMPFAGDSIAVAGAMLETMLLDCPECMGDYTKNNMVFLGGQVPTPYRMLCRKEVGTAESLKGLRMRGGGTAMSRTAEALGGIAVSMTAGDMYEAMERGQLDCVIGSMAWLKSYSLAEVVDYVVEEPLGVVGGLGLLTFNKQSWDGLSSEHKQVILKQMPFIVAASTVSGYLADDIKAKELATSKHGVKFVSGDDEMRSVLATANDAARKLIVAAAKKRGVENPEKIMDTYLDNLKKWSEISQTQVKGDVTALEKVLWEEVYSKVKL